MNSSQTTIIKFFMLLSMFVLFTACPSDTDNITDSSRYSEPGTDGYDSIIYNYSVSDIVSHTKNQAPTCSSGTRIDMHVVSSDLNSQSTLSVSASPLSGGVVAYYVGESYWKDLMIICRTSDGQYNITISFCPYTTVLTASSSITAFWAPYGISIASNSTGIGSITSAKNTYVRVEGGSYQSINFGPTTFYPVQIGN